MATLAETIDTPDLPQTPDFDSYPIRHRLAAVRAEAGGVTVSWTDGLESRHHPIWLRENAPDAGTCHPVTREQVLMIHEIPADLAAVSAAIDPVGALLVDWSTGEQSRYHPGWLRAHALNGATDAFSLPDQVIWDSTLGDLPRFDGRAVQNDEAELGRWAEALHIYGAAILENLGDGLDVVEKLPSLLGPIRTTNFGHLFDVQTKPDADSNAYTAMGLPAHVDLATREYMPGLQFLHCLKNDATGGESLMADGFHLARLIEGEAPEVYEALLRVPLLFQNKARNTDYRYEAPMFGRDREGRLDEIRWSPWLRGPVVASFEDTDLIYRGLRLAFELAERPENMVKTKLKSGDMLCFDNRRCLHGRAAFDPNSGARHLRGCYVEREELVSRLRILARHRRADEVERA